jgi:spermidine/putrescine transport system permease protein
VILYFIFLFAPLLVTCILAFNDSQFPSLPWKGFTVEWFTANLQHRVGIFHDQINLDSIWVSIKVAFFVTLIATSVGTCGAFLFEQEDFRFKELLYFLMLAPLVIPGVILGISILMFSTTLGLFFEEAWNIDVALFRPGFWLVVLGQFSFIATLVTLVVSARLKKFDRTLEEAAMNLGHESGSQPV